jgi:hypothetical protein
MISGRKRPLFFLYRLSRFVTSQISLARMAQWKYKKAAVFPFKGDTRGGAPDTFAESFHEKFPQIELVRRDQVLEAFQQQDLYSDRIDEATRREIGQIFGVQAFVVGDVYYPSIFCWLLQIQGVDVGSGEVMGRSFVEIKYVGAEGIGETCRITAQNLTRR